MKKPIHLLRLRCFALLCTLAIGANAFCAKADPASAHGSEAVSSLLKRFRKASDPHEKRLQLRDIAELREGARTAGPALLAGLSDDNWDVRLATARTLGYIGYVEAAPQLGKLLENEEDWRLVLSAAEALARLKAKDAVPAVQKVAESHWYPPVRKVAREALNSLRTSIPYEPSYPKTSFPAEFFGYENVSPAIPEDLYHWEISKGRLPVSFKPVKRLKVAGGELVAEDNGEWGGSIHFVKSGVHPRKIFSENAQAIYRVGEDVFALTGLAHMGSNDGAIVKMRMGENDRWSIANWRVLPGQAWSFGLLKNGDLLVNCFRGGLVQVSPDGKMKYLEPSEVF